MKTRWVIEGRLPLSGFDAPWSPVYSWPDDDELFDEVRANSLVAIYQRAMPAKEFRKRGVQYDPATGFDDDIPF